MVFKASATIASENFISHYEIKRPVSWAAHFRRSAPLDVEIGSGLGEFLIRCAQQEPDRNFIGLEYDRQRIHKSLYKVRRSQEAESPGCGNLRFLHVDAWVAFERLFEPRSINRIFALFPCPWPKKKHVRHRLFSNEFLKLLNSRLVDGGQAKIVTDHEAFTEWIQAETPQAGFTVKRGMTGPQFDTKFERKWYAQGQQEFFFLELKKTEHVSVPVMEDCDPGVYFFDDFDPERFVFPNVIGEVVVILKDFLFDPKKERGLVHMVVAEKSLVQHIRFMIARSPLTGRENRWSIMPAEGQLFLPTQGVALALKEVHETVRRGK